MSAPQKFRDLPAALAAYRAGTCRRWVEVDGWQIDLVQAATVVEPVDVVADERMLRFARAMNHRKLRNRNPLHSFAEAWNHAVQRNIADALRTEATVEELPPLAEPSIAAPPVECCRACGRPLIGGAP